MIDTYVIIHDEKLLVADLVIENMIDLDRSVYKGR